jgi:hypothetical protein
VSVARHCSVLTMRAMAAVTLLAFGTLALGGCSSTIASIPWIGEPANTPRAPEGPQSYLPVHDVPPPRDQAVLTDAEQTKLKKDLQSARDKQNAQGEALAKSAGATK